MAPVEPFHPDPRQYVVLDHADGAMLVSGGSGAGKTAVLRERFARLVERGADPERVALVVGSRRARDEARRLLLERLPVALPNLTVVTIHGLAFHVVGQRFERLGYVAPPTVLSASEQFARVRELLDGEDPERWPVLGSLLKLRGFADEVRQLVIRAQEALRSPDDIEREAAERGLAGWDELAAFLRHYLSVLDASSEVDFAGLVEQASVAAGGGDPPFDHVMIDDYQDTTFAAERFLAEIRPRSFVAAGDLDAHLFSFQGTTDEPFRRFAERNPGAASVELETRHRPEPASTEAWRAGHVSEQHAAVARELRRLHVDDEVPWRELAVVVRRHGPHVEGLLRALDDAHVPRRIADAGSPAAIPATRPFVLALRWLVAGPQERDALIEPVLTSELGRLSPASVRTLLRLARAHGRPPREALALHDLAEPEDAQVLQALAGVLERAEAVDSSVLDAFRVLWLELPFAADLVERAETDHHALVDLDAVIELSDAVAAAGSSADPSTEAFLLSLGAAEGAPSLAAGDEGGHDEVHVLTAHAAAGREFDTVIVLDALEGDFPSLSRPEPMFDLATLEGAIARSEVNRRRLADERRLFGMVRSRARHRVLLTATDPHGDESSVTLTSRFVEELGLPWRDVPSAPFAEPVSTFEAASAWRRGLGDPNATAAERLAGLDGLLALGDDPARWWFQRDWTDLSAVAEDTLSLSYSRLSTLENCELQFVLSSELGLDPGGGYQAWVGKLVHSIIEGCERGEVERTPEAFERVLDERWEKTRFPSYAISEAERANAKTVLIRNWFERYARPPATATERGFAFEFEGARIRGKIDRIGPVPEGGTRITDYKTGRSDSAPKPAESLQLGIYYLAVNEDDELAEHRPVQAVELAFLGGKKADPALDVKAWSVSEDVEEDYKARMRERLTELIDRIRELNEERRYVANTKASCFFCRFQTLCTRYPQGGAVFPVDAPATAPAEAVAGS
jgi:superfamily I DNA/RNA helicase/RecB family exonuclease